MKQTHKTIEYEWLQMPGHFQVETILTDGAVETENLPAGVVSGRVGE